MKPRLLLVVFLLLAVVAGCEESSSGSSGSSSAREVQQGATSGVREGTQPTTPEWAKSIPGTTVRECVYVNPLLEKMERSGDIRSGDFVAGNFRYYVRNWEAENPGKVRKLYWVPLHPGGMPPLKVKAVPLAHPEKAHTVRYSAVAYGGESLTPFYPGGIRLAEAGRWRLTGVAGSNWGCFELKIREGTQPTTPEWAQGLPGTAEPECVYVNPLLEKMERSREIRSGEFVTNSASYIRDWKAEKKGKLYWVPLHPGGMPPLKVKAVPLAHPEKAHTVRYSTGFSTDNGERPDRFYSGGIRLAEAGKWRLIGVAGSNWGCFELKVPG